MRLKPNERQLFMPRAIRGEPSAVILVSRERVADDAVLCAALSELGAKDASAVDYHVGQLRKRQAGAYDWAAKYSQSEAWDWWGLINFFELPVHQSEVEGVKMEWTLDAFNPDNRECRFPFHDPDVCGFTLTVNGMALREQAKQTGPRWICQQQFYFRELLKRVVQVLEPQVAFGGGICDFALSFYFGKKRMPANAEFKAFHWSRALYTAADWQSLGLADRWDAGAEKIIPVKTAVPGGRFREMFPLTLYRQDLPGGYVYLYSNAESFAEGILCGDSLGLPYACANPLKELPF